MQGITRFATGFPIQMNQGDGDASLVGQFGHGYAEPGGPGGDCESAQSRIPIVRLSTHARHGMLLPARRICREHHSRDLWHLQPALLPWPRLQQHRFRLIEANQIHENYAFDLRVEFFNIFNHAQFKNPGGNITDSTFGIVTNARDPRIGQVSAKFYW